MSVIDEISKEQNDQCALAAILLSMDSEEREDFIVALKDRDNFKTMPIVRVLTKRGHKIGRQRVGNCRMDCSCGLLEEKS